MPDGTILAAAAVAAMLYFSGKAVVHGTKVLGQKIGHELKYEPPKILHALGIHRGHLKKEK